MSRTLTKDEGNVVVEFAAVVIAAIVPLAFLSQACWTVAKSQLAMRAGVHAASRSYALSPTISVGTNRARSVFAAAMNDAGIGATKYSMTIKCSGICLAAGSFVTVSAQQNVRVSLPLGSWTLKVHAADTSVVDEYR